MSVFKKAMESEYEWPYYFGLFDQWVGSFDAPSQGEPESGF